MNRLTLTFGLAAMDLCWFYPWSVLIGLWAANSTQAPLLSAPSVLGLVLLGALSTQVLGKYVANSRRSRLGLASLAALAALVAVRLDHYPTYGLVDWLLPVFGALASAIGDLTIPVVAFAFSLYLWWRGVRLGSQTASYVEVESAFRWGIAALLLFGVVVGLATRSSVQQALESATTPFVVGFFFVSLITLALGRLESLRTRARRVSLNTQWFGVLIVVAALVVLLALLTGQLLSFDVLSSATRPLFDLLGYVLVALVYAIVIPLAYVIEWLVYLIRGMLSGNFTQPPPQPPQPADINSVVSQFLAEQVPPWVIPTLKAAGAALAVAIVLLIVARALSRWRPSSADADATNEERDSLFDPQKLRALLLSWLRRLLRRHRPIASAASAPDTAETGETEVAQLSSVRQLYVRLLREGEAVGVKRSVATTPLEHEGPLEGALDPDEVIIQLTDAYVQARYGELEPDAAQRAALRDQLARLHPIDAPD